MAVESPVEQSDKRPLPSRRTLLGGLAAASAAGLLKPRRSFAQQGTLTLYSSLAPDAQKRLSDAFTQKAGITVNTLRLSSAPLAERFFAEQKAGQHVCDVLQLSDDPIFRQASQMGLLAKIDDIPGVAAIKAPWRTTADYFVTSAQGLTIAYNTKNVTGNSIPKSWADVVKPEFAGQIILEDPRADNVIGPFYMMLRRTYGDDFLRKLAAQRPTLVVSFLQGVQQVASGEAKLCVPCAAAAALPLVQKGAPLALIPIPSPSTALWNYSGIISTAPHMDAARQWMQYIATPEAQTILCKDILLSPLDNIPGAVKTPAELVSISEDDWVPVKNQFFDLLGLPA